MNFFEMSWKLAEDWVYKKLRPIFNFLHSFKLFIARVTICVYAVTDLMSVWIEAMKWKFFQTTQA
jgi:hypothetical protein